MTTKNGLPFVTDRFALHLVCPRCGGSVAVESSMYPEPDDELLAGQSRDVCACGWRGEAYYNEPGGEYLALIDRAERESVDA